MAELNAVRDFLFNSAPVVEIGGTEFQKDNVSLVDKVSEYFTAQYGNRAVSPDLGEVILDRRGVKSSMAHGIGAVKAAAYAAVHDVIEKGKVFDRQRDWKGRGKDTAVIAAPVRIGEKDYICEVVVETSGRGNEFYLHEVNLKEKIAETIKTPTGGAASANNAQPFVRSIFAQKWSEVNPSAVSKVVDENGEPMVVYHHTPWDALQDKNAAFRRGHGLYGNGVYLTSNPKDTSYDVDDTWRMLNLLANIQLLNIKNDSIPTHYKGSIRNRG